MKQRFATWTILICVLLAVAQARAESIEVPVEGGTLVLDTPKDWRGTVSGPLYSPTLQLAPVGKGDFKVVVTAIAIEGRVPEDAVVERRVREAGEAQLPGAIQTTLDVKPVKGAQARGYVYHVTDKNPEKGPGEYKEMHQGALVVEPLLLSVTILTHTPDAAIAEAALSAIAGARYRAAPK